MSLRISFWSILLCLEYAVGILGQAYSVTDYIVAGTGCPPGTTTATISSTGKAFTLVYSSFVAQTGSGTTYSDTRKNCQATLNVQVPAGYQFAINKANYNGAYSLSSGASASYATTYYFQASLQGSTGTGTVNGPASVSSSLSNSLTPAVWSPCGKASLVNINTVIRVPSGTNKSGYFTLDSLDILESSFVWRTC